jgi:hypothetical protein
MRGNLRLGAAPDPAWPGRRPGIPTALQQLTQRLPTTPSDAFVALPRPAGRPPFRRRLADVLSAERIHAIDQAGVVRFHCVGDTGGWRDPIPQREVVAAMASELDGDPPVHFFYHLGDVVYPHGEEVNYGPQFLSPYADYRVPIFAIPGNHDAESHLGTRADRWSRS